MMTGIFNSSFSRILFFSQVIFFLTTITFQQEGNAQVYQSAGDGAWDQGATWNRANNCTAGNISGSVPPVSKSWGCPVEVTILHEVAYTGNANGFGSGVFTGIHIGAQGSLTFQNNVTVNGGGSVPNITLDEGAELIVNGTFALDRSVTLTIPKNAKVTIDNLVIGDNGVVINVEQGGELLVTNTTTMKSQATLNVRGRFDTHHLNYTSGGAINGLSDQSRITVAGDLNMQNGQLNMSQKSMFNVGGGLNMSGSAAINLRNNSQGSIGGDVTIPNGNISLRNDTELFIGGKLTASNGGEVNGMNNASVYLCDYQNSTKESTYHINLKNNAFYGQGCFALPVVWKSFEVAKSTQSKVDLIWKTAKENENSHYEVERSLGGIHNFKIIGKVDAAGWTNTETSYHFIDEVIPTGDMMVYYRLRQVDFSGGYQYSEVKAIKATFTQPDNDKWIAFPNPTNGESLNVKLSSGNGTFKTTIKARLLHGGQSETFEAADDLVLNQWLNNEIKKAPKGICVLELAYGGNVYHIKVIKI